MKESGTFATLRRFARPCAAEERCELCSTVLAPGHRHLLEMETHKVACACDPCAFRFQDVVGGRFKLIPRDARKLPDFRLTDATWENFALPINLAFFFYSSPREKIVALYPSPAGPTESLLSFDAWENLVADNIVLARMEPDVEALLVNRVQEPEYFLAPIDVCYELVGLVRLHWKGFTGGEEVWRELDAFFSRLRSGAIEQAASLEESRA